MKLVFVAHSPVPYSTAFLNQLAAGCQLHVIYLAGERGMLVGDDLWAGFDDPWGEPPDYPYGYHPSRTIKSSRMDFAVQLSIGVSLKLGALNPDVVMVHGWLPPMVEPLLWAATTGRGSIMWSESTRVSGLLRDPSSNLVRRGILGLTSAFVTNGSEATEYLLNLHVPASRIVTSRLPSNLAPRLLALPDRSRENRDWERPRFLYVGRLVERKGITDLLAAFSAVQRTYPGARLSIVGDGPLLNTIRSRGIDAGNVAVVGRVEGDALIPWFHESDVLVVPSQREVWGHVVHEGMAAGMQVIATSEVGAAADLLVDGAGIVVPPRDTVALAAAMARAVREGPPNQQTVAARRDRAASVNAGRFAADVLAAASVAIGSRRGHLRRLRRRAH